MVDENLSNCEISHQHQLVNMISHTDTDMDDLEVNAISENIHRSSYDTSTPSPESTSENAFSFNGSKFTLTEDKSNEKKVHWNPSQVISLLDCIEKRLCDFKKKSVEKSVWLSIGKEMSDQGSFSVENCYNKWKNLRRDVRLFNNSSTMQKLSIRNAYIMERVQKLVLEIGYENLSRKSSSPISPNFDVMDSKESLKGFQLNGNPKKEPWVSFPEIKCEQNATQDNITTYVSLEESIISLLSDPSVSQTILMNPKLLEEILPGLDIGSILKRFVDSHPDVIPQSLNSHSKSTTTTSNNNNNNNNGHQPRKTAHKYTQLLANHTYAHNILSYSNPRPVINVGSGNDRQMFLTSQQSSSVDLTHSWPHQLYELLHNFREEESRQIQRLDQIVNYVQVMQESTKRRLSTINQLISLAGMLVPQR